MFFIVLRVWNDAAAHRLTTMGHSVRRGDLVWLREGQNKLEDARETSMAQVRRHRRKPLVFVLVFLMKSLLKPAGRLQAATPYHNLCQNRA